MFSKSFSILHKDKHGGQSKPKQVDHSRHSAKAEHTSRFCYLTSHHHDHTNIERCLKELKVQTNIHTYLQLSALSHVLILAIVVRYTL